MAQDELKTIFKRKKKRTKEKKERNPSKLQTQRRPSIAAEVLSHLLSFLFWIFAFLIFLGEIKSPCGGAVSSRGSNGRLDRRPPCVEYRDERESSPVKWSAREKTTEERTGEEVEVLQPSGRFKLKKAERF